MIDEVAKELHAEVYGERDLASSLAKRIVLASARGAAMKAGGEPGPPEEVEVVMRDMVRRRSLPTAARNGSHAQARLGGARPPRTEAEEAKAAEEELADDPTSIPLPMEQEQPPNVTERPVLHQTYVEAEGEYWAAVDTRPVKLEAKERGGECTALGFSRCGRYVCMGTAGGGVVVWHVGEQPARLTRKLAALPCDAANAVSALSWSADSSELVAVDAAGYARVWGMCGEAGEGYALTAARSASFWVMSEAKEAADELAAAQREGLSQKIGIAEKRKKRAEERMRAMKLDEEQATWEAAKGRPVWSRPPKAEGIGALRGADVTPQLVVAVRHPQLYFKELLSADTNPAGAPATADDGAENKGNLEEKSGGGFFGKLFKGGGGDGPKGAAAEARARAKEEAASDPLLPLRPRLAEFHPSFTLLGSQPSFCLALAGGIIAKINRPGAERVVHSRPLFLPRGLATDEEADEGRWRCRGRRARARRWRRRRGRARRRGGRPTRRRRWRRSR